MMDSRYELVLDRIKEICDEKVLGEPVCSYFNRGAGFLILLDKVFKISSSGRLFEMDRKELENINRQLYEDIVGKNYDNSYANPEYIVKLFKKGYYDEDIAGYLCFLWAEIRGLIPYAYESNEEILTLYMELFVEIYCIFTTAAEEKKSGGLKAEEIRQCIYWFERDNCEIVCSLRVKEQLDPSCDYALRIIRECDLMDPVYLYYFGEYISDAEIKLAEYINSLDEEEVRAMAKTYTEGYRIGFYKTGKDISRKKTVNIRFPLGFERMVKYAVEQFEAMGLKCIIYRASGLSLNKKGHVRIGYYGAIPNKQYDYDHREDEAIYLDNDYVNRKLDVLRMAYEDNKELAAVYAGPAVIEEFGQEPFAPVNKPEAFVLSDKQRKLSVKYVKKSSKLMNEYIKGDENSFTIIAYPKPYIGNDFEAIFKETVKLNTLDYNKYEKMQQIIIDVLDKANYVRVAGKGKNKTEIIVALNELKDPQKETNFENCVADVNIPLGEVFTSPKLKGTAGILHSPCIYLGELKYIDLWLEFSEGVIVKYSCKNFDTEEANKRYIEDNLLHHHKTLPMGEFAIGTNTTAYRMARDYGIEGLLPILIGEKTGPHFAVGDTCYSHEEDIMSYNPDGKAIVARSNDYADLRNTDPDKAYFSCHTDITIPYDELGGVYAIKTDGTQTAVIEDGLFVLEGLLELNEPLLRGR
ncbi:MAG: aminopeptidase [Lachnospiraceae bacterium]|nr:aminopeptidase [Lachnospiraceae bacterium]